MSHEVNKKEGIRLVYTNHFIMPYASILPKKSYMIDICNHISSNYTLLILFHSSLWKLTIFNG